MEKGVKELKELLDGFEILYFFVKERAADGIDWSDGTDLISRLITDDVFRDELVEAFSGFAEMEKELSDLSFEEGIELVQYLLEKMK